MRQRGTVASRVVVAGCCVPSEPVVVNVTLIEMVLPAYARSAVLVAVGIAIANVAVFPARA